MRFELQRFFFITYAQINILAHSLCHYGDNKRFWSALYLWNASVYFILDVYH